MSGNRLEISDSTRKRAASIFARIRTQAENSEIKTPRLEWQVDKKWPKTATDKEKWLDHRKQAIARATIIIDELQRFIEKQEAIVARNEGDVDD